MEEWPHPCGHAHGRGGSTTTVAPVLWTALTVLMDVVAGMYIIVDVWEGN